MKKKHYLVLALSLVFIGGLIVSCAPSKQPDYQADPSPGTGQQTRFTPRTNQRGPGPVPAPSPKPGGMGTQMERRAPRNSPGIDRKSTRLNSSHVRISYAVFCLKKKIKKIFLISDPRWAKRSSSAPTFFPEGDDIESGTMDVDTVGRRVSRGGNREAG